MSNSKLFTEAHKMTKLTIKPDETYRYKFGQWLTFLKTGISNKLGITSINQSVCYVPILNHDKAAKADEFAYSEYYYLGKMLLLFTALSLLAYLVL